MTKETNDEIKKKALAKATEYKFTMSTVPMKDYLNISLIDGSSTELQKCLPITREVYKCGYESFTANKKNIGVIIIIIVCALMVLGFIGIVYLDTFLKKKKAKNNLDN
jgi:hypothetical protein